jgi:hypothetical protein
VSALAFELHAALLPIRSAVRLLRRCNFDVEISRAVADQVEAGLERALASLEPLVRGAPAANDAHPRWGFDDMPEV